MRTLSAVIFAAVLAHGQSIPRPAFDVASIRVSTPSREEIDASAGTLTMRSVKLSTCIRWAYKLNVYEISGPDWIESARFDITAKSENRATEDQLRLMLRTLLDQRFRLVAHRAPKAVSGYELVIGNDRQLKLQAAEGGGEGSMTGAALLFEGHKMPLSRLTDIVSSALKAPVRDGTGLTGFYDFKLDLRPYITPLQPGDPPRDPADLVIPALRDELGLKLEFRKITLDVLVVDQMEKTPTEN